MNSFIQFDSRDIIMLLSKIQNLYECFTPRSSRVDCSCLTANLRQTQTQETCLQLHWQTYLANACDTQLGNILTRQCPELCLCNVLLKFRFKIRRDSGNISYISAESMSLQSILGYVPKFHDHNNLGTNGLIERAEGIYIYI